jgi:hypothetical protein
MSPICDRREHLTREFLVEGAKVLVWIHDRDRVFPDESAVEVLGVPRDQRFCLSDTCTLQVLAECLQSARPSQAGAFPPEPANLAGTADSASGSLADSRDAYCIAA